MPTWKLHRGEDFAVQGVVTYATVAGATLSPLNLIGGVLTFHMGQTLDNPFLTRAGTSGGTSFNTDNGGTSGTYVFYLSPADTDQRSSGSYLYDIWFKTAGGKEYCLTVGTVELQGVVGTI